MRVLALAILVLPAAAPARAAHPCASGTALTGTLEADAGGDGFRLVGQDVTFTLAGLVSARALALNAEGAVRLHPASRYLDRHGRLPVFAWSGDTWLQATHMRLGAVADPAGLEPACAAALLDAEPARAALPAEDAARIAANAGQFVSVRGQVRSIGDRERVLYLNFGTKWDEDFTVSIAKSGRNRYRGDVEALKASTGRTITVRGAIELRGGPLVRLRDEARIRIED